MKADRGTLFIVSGPSGVGKTTLVLQFLQQVALTHHIARVVTYTTRTPRAGEIDGVDFHFIDEIEFQAKMAQGFFLEWSGEYGSYYGTPTHIIDTINQGQSFILVIDRVGAAQIKVKHPLTILIWVKVSSIDILADRLFLRKTESEAQIQRRLFLAKKEIEQEAHVGMYDHHIINDDLKVALESVSSFVLPYCFSVKKDIV